MPSFKIIIKKKNGDVVVNKTFESFPNKQIAQNWANDIAKLKDATVANVTEIKTK